MKYLVRISCILLALPSVCFAYTDSGIFLQKSNTADHVVIARKISGFIGCELYSGDRIRPYEEMCSDKIFSENVSAYNETKRKEEFVVLTTVFGKKLPGEVLSFDIIDPHLVWTHVGHDYLMFIYDRAGVLNYDPCAVFHYEDLKVVLDQKPSIETLFNKLREKPSGSCPAPPVFPETKSKLRNKKPKAP